MELAVHEFAMSCGKWPWEAWDAPADALMHAIAVESEKAKGQALLQKIQKSRSGSG